MKGEIRTYIQICLYLHGETLGKTHKKLKRPFLGRRWIGWAEVGGRGRKVRLLWQKAEEREAGGGGEARADSEKSRSIQRAEPPGTEPGTLAAAVPSASI